MLLLDSARILKVPKTLAVGGRLGWNYETLNAENRASQHALTTLVKVANRILFARLQNLWNELRER